MLKRCGCDIFEYPNITKALLLDPRVVSPKELEQRLASQRDTSSNFFFHANSGESNPTRYDESYTSLRDWSLSSLEVYRPELVCGGQFIMLINFLDFNFVSNIFALLSQLGRKK
jgi:hypothetical protein